MASSQTEPPPPFPSGRSRHRTGLFIAAFVGLQFVIPLSYLVREDPSDERFTWRTVSSTEAETCTARASIQRFDGTEEALALETLLHAQWVDYVGEGRLAVVDAFLLSQCEREDVRQAALITTCDDERGEREFSLRCGGERAYETTRTATR